MKMDSLVQDVLNANMVFLGIELMNKSGAQDNLAETANAEVAGADIGFSMTPGGVPEPSRRFVLQRDRISLDIAPARSSVTMEYPPRDFAQLAKIVACAIENTNIEEVQSAIYGYNMTLVLAPNLAVSAVEHLGNRLFAPHQPFGREDWKRTGGLGTLYFSDGKRRWTFSIEPRPRDDTTSKKLFMSINLHLSDANFPDENDISGAFSEMLGEAEHFTNQLIME